MYYTSSLDSIWIKIKKFGLIQNKALPNLDQKALVIICEGLSHVNG